MNGLLMAALAITAVAVVIGALRLSARLTVVEWHGPVSHPRHAPRPGPAEVARMRAELAALARQAGGTR